MITGILLLIFLLYWPLGMLYFKIIGHKLPDTDEKEKEYEEKYKKLSEEAARKRELSKKIKVWKEKV